MATSFYQSICANECRNTHHKLVMNSLMHLQVPAADQWRDMFVRHFDIFLEGSKDPDTKFRDFRNHVLHVQDNFWGGAVGKVESWYEATVQAFRDADWKTGIYSAGVMSHYFMDPVMPLHTGQTEEEGVIHRACEWSINKAFDDIISQLESGPGYPEVELADGSDWLAKTVRAAAVFANGFYDDYLDHYDLKAGASNPPEGLNDHLRTISGTLLGYASVGFARILDRAILESASLPIRTTEHPLRWLYRLTLPFTWLLNAVEDWTGNRRIRKVLNEFERNGKVILGLSGDEQQVRRAFAEEVLQVDIEELDRWPLMRQGKSFQSTSGSKTASKTSLKFRLDLSDDLEKAPSIGEKTAARFAGVGIKTVVQFLKCDPADIARQLKANHISAQEITRWQVQTRLACRIPRIYGHDAQIMEACGFETPEEVANSDVESILALVDEFRKTSESKFILRSSRPPDEREVSNWIDWAGNSRPLEVN